ncbi:hypothetical protein H1D32_12030 [Anaerobacillus sp. CMMVII]|uniref:hypothetical protein n=1 Tax=Anaerobacillus sp. CMMVII TaxID=2755588 RepID=UPI0021B846B8|nr:hypothetical protein [Anaerobacillus sp. CMMVII]MCT8138410.1 hypothetical protein [Anaerobacillus sp. CMMVII]
MRVGYCILKEIDRGIFIPQANDYGLKEREFENFIFYLERNGYLERVLSVNDYFSINAARLTQKGIELLEQNKDNEESYPERKHLKSWVQIEKDLYSNDATD